MHYNHICTLDHAVKHSQKQSVLFKLFCVSTKNPQTRIYFRSVAAVTNEVKRHLGDKSRCVIHPFSIFRFLWELMMLLILFISMVVFPINTFSKDYTSFTLGVISDVFCIVDIFLSFFTGYCILEKKEVVLRQKQITKHHLHSIVFHLYIIGCIPIDIITRILRHLRISSYIVIRCLRLFNIFKAFRMILFLKYFDGITELIRNYYYLRTSIKYIILFAICLHWLTCSYMVIRMFDVEMRDGDFYENLQYAMKSRGGFSMYIVSMYRMCSYLMSIPLLSGFQKSLEYVGYTTDLDLCIFLIFSTFGFIFSNLLLVVILQMIISVNSSKTKYFSILSQVYKFIEYKDLPNSMRDRITSYYEYRYQKKFFRESTILDMLSETLRRDIYLHSCRALIQNVSLLKDLPPEIISEVVSNLKHEVFLYNDVIIKAGTGGDCMFFISNGTVAVTTPTGKEICHLQDGAYFGEIALITNEQKRVANVVAIEICELYRLDRRNFRTCFPANSIYYKRIEQIARERMEKTLLLEELHKKYILDRITKRKADEATTAHQIDTK